MMQTIDDALPEINFNLKTIGTALENINSVDGEKQLKEVAEDLANTDPNEDPAESDTLKKYLTDDDNKIDMYSLTIINVYLTVIEVLKLGDTTAGDDAPGVFSDWKGDGEIGGNVIVSIKITVDLDEEGNLNKIDIEDAKEVDPDDLENDLIIITNPVTAITTKPPALSNLSTAEFGFISNKSGSTFQCELDGIGFSSCTSPVEYPDLSDGEHTFCVRAVDSEGNTDLTPACHTWTVDTMLPDTTITGKPSDPSSSSSANFSFTSSESGSTFECQIDGGGWSSCTSPRDYSGFLDGSHTFEVRATDAAGNTDQSPASYTWTVSQGSNGLLLSEDFEDNSLDSRISIVTTGTFNSNPGIKSITNFGSTKAFGYGMSTCAASCFYNYVTKFKIIFPVPTYVSSISFKEMELYGNWGSHGEIYIDGTALTTFGRQPFNDWQADTTYRSKSLSVNKVATTIELNVVDITRSSEIFIDDLVIYGNQEVDTDPPDTMITGQPSDPSGSNTASFGFTSTEAGSTFECRMDGGDWSTCTSPNDYTGLADGSHTFEVRATDVALNTDPTPASYTWMVDTTLPNTLISGQPPDPSNSGSADFSFISTETGSTFECQLDSAVWSACASPMNYSGLSYGSHTFMVRATDAAGNTDGSPASYTWTVDTEPPDTAITGMPSNPSNSNLSRFTFEATETGSTFECQMDGGGWSGCVSPKDYAGLPGGSHTFEVRATDVARNTDPTPAIYTWTVPQNPNSLVAYFPFNGNANDESGNNYNGTVYGAALATDRFGNADSAYSFDGVDDYIGVANTSAFNFASGGFTLAAWVNFTADNADTAIIGKHINNYGNGYFLGAGNYNNGGPASVFNFFVDRDPRLATAETFNDGNWHHVAGVYDGTTQYLYVDGVLKVSQQRAYASFNDIDISIGRHSVQSALYNGYFNGLIDEVRIYNRALSASEIEELTIYGWVEDFEKYPAGNLPSPDWSYSGNSDIRVDNTLSVSGNQSARLYGREGACWGALLHRPLNIAPPFSVELYAYNGNESLSGCHPQRASMALFTGPDWTYPGRYLAGFDADGTLRGGLDGSPGGTVLGQYPLGQWVKVKVAYEVVDASTVRISYWGEDLFLTSETLPALSYEASLVYLSPHVNEGTAWFDDIKVAPYAIDTPPETIITSNPSGISNSSSANFGFTSNESGATFECQLDGGGYIGCTSPAVYTGLLDGSHTFEVRATGMTGITDPSSASYTWTVDTVPPDTSITGQPSDPSSSDAASFEFVSNETGSTFECQIDGGGWSGCTSPKTYPGLLDGNHIFDVRATDVAGNTDGSPASYTWTINTSDTMPPVNTTGGEFINGGAAETNSATVTLTVSATDNVGVTAYCVLDNDTGLEPPAPVSNAGCWVPVSSNPDYNANVYHTFTSTYPSGTTVQVYVWFKDASGNVSGPASDSIKFTRTIFSADFEGGWGTWYADNGVWQVGTPTNPNWCYGQCAGTVLDGNYPADTDSRLISPTFQLPTVTGSEEVHLRFWNWFSYAGGDYGQVQISVKDPVTLAWGAWVSVGTSVWATSGWSLKDVDLTAYAGKTVRIAFYHIAGCSGSWCSDWSVSTGWYIDDIQILKF